MRCLFAHKPIVAKDFTNDGSEYRTSTSCGPETGLWKMNQRIGSDRKCKHFIVRRRRPLPQIPGLLGALGAGRKLKQRQLCRSKTVSLKGVQSANLGSIRVQQVVA